MDFFSKFRDNMVSFFSLSTNLMSISIIHVEYFQEIHLISLHFL